MNKISNKKIELLKQICAYRQKYGRSPSFRELKKLTHLSDVKSVYRIVESLIKADYLTKEKNKSRSIKLTDRGMEVIGLSSLPITFMPTPSLLDQLHKPSEFSKNDITISSHSQEFIGYGNKSLENNGTDTNSDLKSMIKAEVNSAITQYFDSTSSQGNDPKQIVIKGVTNIFDRLLGKEVFIDIFGWGLLIIFLTWVFIMIIGNNATALVYSVIIALVIKNFLNK